MLAFESYFGISIKFLNPACLTFILSRNLYFDIYEPYNDAEPRMHLLALIYVFIAILILIIPICFCGYPEEFDHNVNLEFMADNLFEMKLKMAN
jgi:hypothetical protein